MTYDSREHKVEVVETMRYKTVTKNGKQTVEFTPVFGVRIYEPKARKGVLLAGDSIADACDQLRAWWEAGRPNLKEELAKTKPEKVKT